LALPPPVARERPSPYTGAMASPPLSISANASLSGSVSIPDSAIDADFRLDAVDEELLAGPCFFWESPDGECVSLIGAARKRELRGPEPWAEARLWLRDVAESARPATGGRSTGAAPIAFGGFSFDGGPAVEWDLPAGVAMIPALQWRRDPEGRTELTSWGPAEPGFGPERDGSPAERDGSFFEEWSRDDWSRAVDWALDRIRTGGVEKLVLARSRTVRAPRGWDTVRAFTSLREAYPACFRFLYRDGSGGAFLGASPERLVSLRGGRVRADAVAGTARLGAPNGGEAARALLDDPKERREHEVVAREIVAALRAVCPDASAPPEPALLPLRGLAHLRTPVVATAAPGTHVLDLVSRLHPTPAVAGTPRDEALKLIRVIEPRGRGWYAGPIGWMTPAGEGDFAVGIRSAFVRDGSALLYAGAGIVAGSQPEREWDECEAKLGSIEDVLFHG
jgi:menaquinone-specific isochorismate synthase